MSENVSTDVDILKKNLRFPYTRLLSSTEFRKMGLAGAKAAGSSTSPSPRPSPPPTAREHAESDNVDANYQDSGKWYPGKIGKVNGGVLYTVYAYV